MQTPPPWLDRVAYPFPSRAFATAAGDLHYVDSGGVDSGGGQPVVFVHGNPDWSFAYRHVMTGLAGRCRTIAVDHLGFGLSDKPTDWDYLPSSHAANFAAFADHLDLDRVVLVVNDWGGPIALPWALAHPERVAGLVLMNTWCWSTNGDWYYELFSRMFGGTVGRQLIRRANVFTRLLLPLLVRDPAARTPEVRRHFTRITPRGVQRKGSWTLPGQIMKSGPWLDRQWDGIGRLAQVPVSIVWGARDPIFIRHEYRRWAAALPNSTLTLLDDVGHYPHEDRPDAVIAAIRTHLHASDV